MMAWKEFITDKCRNACELYCQKKLYRTNTILFA
jgi:hypothetical protein